MRFLRLLVLTAALAWPVAGWGGVALDTIASGTTDSNGTAQGTNVDNTKHTMGSVSNGAMVAILSFSNKAVTGVTVQWDALGTPQSFSSIKSGNATGAARVDVFGLTGPTAGNKTLRVKWTGGGTSDVGIFTVSYSGVDQTGGATSFPNGNSAAATSAAPAVTITSATGDLTVAGFAAPSAGFNTPSQTEIYNDANLAGINSAGQRETSTSGAASVAFSYTGTVSDTWVAVGASILAASGGGAACPMTRSLMGAGC